MSLRRYWVLSIACALLALGARAASAEELAKPKDRAALNHLAQGNKLLMAGPASAAAAADEYKAGLQIEYAPIFDYNLGQCFRLLGEYNTAIWHYERFIRQSPDTPEFIEKARKHIEKIRGELEQKARTAPPTEPAPISLTQTNTAHTGTATPSAPSNLGMTAAASTPLDPWYSDALGWGFTGVGAIAVGASTGLFLSAASLRDDANAASTQEAAQDLHERADDRQLVATIVGIGSVAILVTGIVKLAVHSDASRMHQASWNLGVSSRGVFVSASF